MIGTAVEKALNDQIRNEFYSSYLYLAMSAWCERENLPGFAKWLRTQHDEERTHGLKLLDYVLDQGGRIDLGTLEAPPATFKDMLDVFRQVAAHERKVTTSIHHLADLAQAEKDWATQVELAWFIKEQVEEEKNAALWVAHLERIGDKSAALLNLDHMAGKRT